MSEPTPDAQLRRRLEAARRRLDEATRGSPEEDAAWNALQALEAALEERRRAAEPADVADPDRGA